MHEHTSELLRVDVSSAATRQDLHALLARAFHFPDYYGHNWDAFDECFRDVKLPPHVEIIGIAGLRVRLPREAKFLEECVADFVAESGHDIILRS